MIQNATDAATSAANVDPTAAQGASADARSLDNLHDIVVPEPSPFWPPANGWYVLFAAAAVLALLLVILLVHRWWSRRYRRAALRELEQLRQRSQQTPVPETIAQVDSLLKRVALAAWPRESVASLSSERWIQFLQATQTPSKSNGETTGSPRGWSNQYLNLVYSSKKRESVSQDQLNDLFGNAENWIRKHDATSVFPPQSGIESQRDGTTSSAGETR